VRVLIVTTEYPPHPGGVATVAYEEARGLANLGMQVRVETVLPGAICAQEKVQVNYRHAPGGAIWRLLPLTWIVLRAMIMFRPHFVHCPTYRGFGLPLYAVARLLRVPYSVYLHGTELNTEKRSGIRLAIMRRVLEGAAVVCTNSENTAAIARELFPGLRNVVPVLPGVHPYNQQVASWSVSTSDNKTRPILLLTVCRMVLSKGVGTVIEALYDLRRRRPDIQPRLACVGDGPHRSEFEELVDLLDLRDIVTFRGALPYQEVQQAYSSADIYVQPSRPVGDFLESFGISFLEAQAAGLPCIGSRWGGVPEAVEEGVTALLVEPGDVAGLSRAIEELCDDPARRVQMGEAGKRRAAGLTWDRHCEQLAGVIREGAGT